MKRRILSLLLVLAMLVTVSVFAVEATSDVPEETTEATEPATPEVVYPNPTKESFDAAVAEHGEAATLDFYCEACGRVQTWTKLTESSIPNKQGDGGHTYVPSAGKAVGQQIVGFSGASGRAADGSTDFCIYLNGDLYRNLSGSSNQYMFRLYAKYTGMDKTTPYHVTMNVMGNGTAKMYTKGEPTTKQNGAVINLSTNDTTGGTTVLNIYEGAVIGSDDVYASNGVLACTVSKSTINMYGGKIVGTSKLSGSVGGGAVYMTYGTFNMHGGEIHGANLETLRGSAVALNSSAKFYMGTNAEKLNTAHLPTIYGSTATRGGAVAITGGADFYIGNGTISGGTATDADYGGGAVYLYSSGTTFNMYKGATISGGVSQNYSGGCVFVSGSAKMNMYGGQIIGGKALGEEWSVGSAVAVHDTEDKKAAFNLYGGTITDDENTSGSLVYLYTGGTVTVDDSAAAPTVGEKEEKALIDATGARRAVQINRGQFNLKNGTISGGKNHTASGASVYMTNAAATFNMTGGRIENGSTAAANGGNVYVNSGTFTMEDGIITGGKATKKIGGNVYVNGGKFEMSGGTISGGASYSEGNVNSRGGNVAINGGEFNMTGGTITGGKEAWFGGNVYCSGGTFTMNGENAKIEANGDASRGGAVALYKAATFKLINGTISGAEVETTGGAIHVEGTFIMDGGVINGSKAPQGGAVYVGGGTFTMNNGTINGGTATGAKDVEAIGGAVALATHGLSNDLTTSTFIMNDGTINGGTAEFGGAVAADAEEIACVFTMNGGTITGGSASKGGNVYVANGSEFTVDNGTIIRGTSTGGGGNVYLNGADMTMNNGKIVVGTGIRGGNVYVTNGTVNMADGVIAAGTATKSGSAFGGNITLWGGGNLNMTGGLMSKDFVETTADGEVAHSGASSHGVNIGVWSKGNTAINLSNGAQILGGIGDGGSIYVGACNEGTDAGVEVPISVGDVVIHSDDANEDIYIANREAAGWTDIGKITVTEAFKDTLVFRFGGNATVLDENKVISDKLAVAGEGYANTGKLVMRMNGMENPVKAEGTSLVLEQAAVFDGENIVTSGTYADVTAAYSENKGEANAQNYIKLFNMDGQTITAAAGDVIDVNGNNVTVDSAAAVAVIDSATNDYDDTDAAKITFANVVGTGADVNLTIDGQQGTRRYALIKNDDDTYGAHRFYITQRNVGIRVNEDDAAPDLIYSGSFRGTQTFAANVEAFGIDFQHEGASLYKVNYLDHEQAFTSGKLIYGKNVNIVVSEQAAKDGYGEKLIKGVPYITLKGGVELTAQVIEEATSVKAQVESFKANYATLSDSQKAIYNAMVEQSGALFTTLGWDYAVA